MDSTAAAKIQNATHQAQRQFLRLDKSGDKALKRAYRLASQNLARSIEAASLGDSVTRLEHLNLLKAQISNTLQDLAYARRDIFQSNFKNAVAIASKPVKAQVSAEVLTGIVGGTLRFVQAFTGNDGLQLSDRLWRVDNGAKEAITRSIEQAVIHGQSASEAAQSFIERGEVVPRELRYKSDSAKTTRLAINAKRYMRTTSYENVRRVFRTELNRAYNQAYESSVFELGDEVIGTRFVLSSNHKKRDICDTHANADLYDLGRGVYPQGKNPCPAHPNTTSYTVVVFADDAKGEPKDLDTKPLPDGKPEQWYADKFLAQFPSGRFKDQFGTTLRIDENLFKTKGKWKIKKSGRHWFAHLLPQTLTNPDKVKVFTHSNSAGKVFKRRLYVKTVKTNAGDIQTLALFGKNKGYWQGQSIYTVSANAKEVKRAGGVDKFIGKVLKGFEQEKVTTLK